MVVVGIDREYVMNLIGEMREGLDEVKEIVTADLNEFIRDRGKRFAMRYSVVLIVEAAADLGIAILKQCFNEEVKSYRDVFLKLGEKGVIGFDVAEGMASLASLRNMIVHRYWGVDDARVYRGAKYGGIDVVEKFIKEVMDYVSKDP